MANHIAISCKNIFKHTDVEELRKAFTEKWVELIKQKNTETRPVS